MNKYELCILATALILFAFGMLAGIVISDVYSAGFFAGW